MAAKTGVLVTGIVVSPKEYHRVYEAIRAANSSQQQAIARIISTNGHPHGQIKAKVWKDLERLQLVSQPNQQEILDIMRAVVQVNGHTFVGMQEGLVAARMDLSRRVVRS